MLNEKQYATGLAIAEQLKYNINYDKSPLFDVVCSGFASRLLNHEYAETLTDKQRELLNNIAKQ